MSSAHAEPAEMTLLAREFTDEMYAGYRYLVKAINYRAKLFLEMVTMHGGVGAAKLLLQGSDASDGFTRLWEEGMLKYSVEAAVLKPKYEVLFTPDELDTARRRLRLHDFDIETYLKGLE